MRFSRTSVIVSLFLLLSLKSNLAHATGDPSISGRLIFENVGFTCDQRCTVTLLESGARPVQMVFADFGGHFTFNNVARGLYSIRVDIDGFESVNHPLEQRDFGLDVTIIVPLVRKTAVSTGGGEVVNVSQFLERYPKKAVSLFEKGSDALKRKKQDEATKYFKNAVELAPTFYEAHHQLGLAYKESGKLDDAEREFLKAHELNSTNIGPLLNLTSLYIDRNDFARAVTIGEQAVKIDSHSAPASFLLGVALYKEAQMGGAETALKRTLELDPKMGNARLMLANVYLKLQRYDNVLEQLNSYIAGNPQGQQLAAAVQMRDQLLHALKASEAEGADAP